MTRLNRGMVFAALMCAAFAARALAQGAPPPGADSLVLTRSFCYGNCPAYRVSVTSSGRITFRPLDPRDTTRGSDSMPSALFGLVSRARAIGFFELPPNIEKDARFCPGLHTDAPYVTISFFFGTQTRTVVDYHGCRTAAERAALPRARLVSFDSAADAALRRLREFEDRIDTELRTSRWAKPYGWWR